MAAGTESDAGASDNPVNINKIEALFGDGFVCVQDILEWGFFVCHITKKYWFYLGVLASFFAQFSRNL